MTEPPRQNEPSPATAEDGYVAEDDTLGWDHRVYPVEEVRELLTTFNKTLRAFQLYDENNPVYKRFVSNLTEAFRALWDEVDQIPVTVQEERIFYRGEEVYKETNHSDSLAFLLYKDGIREMVFLPGVEEDELEPLLEVLQKARNLRKEEDDLLTLFWTADLEYFRYSYVDLMAEGIPMPEAGDGAGAAQLESVMEEELGEEGEEQAGEEVGAKPPSQVNREGFNPTLYSLDPRELERLQEEVQEEMERELKADVLSALFDRLEDPGQPGRQLEILSILGTLLPDLLSRGAVGSAARLLEELKEIREKENVLADEARARSEELLEEMSSSESIVELVRGLEDGTLEPSADELTAFLRHLRAGALSPLLRAAELTEAKELKPILRDAARRIAGRNAEALVSLLDSPDPVVLAGAVRMVGGMRLTEAAERLASLFEHSDSGVRLAAVEAARELRSPTTTEALPGVLGDSDRDVRIAAARALGHLGFLPAASRFKDLMQGKEIRQADITEKIAVFESYGELGDAKAVKFLSGLLNGRGFLGRKEPPEIRAAAALGLGKVATTEALEALGEARSEDDPVIRSAVNRALRDAANENLPSGGEG